MVNADASVIGSRSDMRVRINATARFRRYTNYGWHGLGNATPYERPWELIDPEEQPDLFASTRRFNQYDRIFPQLIFNARIILWDKSKIDNDRVRPCGPKRLDRCPPAAYDTNDAPQVDHKPRLEALVGTELAYNWINPYPDSKLAYDMELADSATADGDTMRALLHGTDDPALWRFNLGLLYDTRDHEFMTTRGSFTATSMAIARRRRPSGTGRRTPSQRCRPTAISNRRGWRRK